jgi:hypothetical protein
MGVPFEGESKARNRAGISAGDVQEKCPGSG